MVDTRFSVSIQIMMTLAAHHDELVNSDFLSKVLKTNPTFVRKLVSNLVAANLIASYRGKGGGIKIAIDPAQISLKEIYLASTDEKPLVNIHKKPVSKTCSVSCCINDVLKNVVTGIEESTQKYLEGKTLQDLMAQVN